MNPQSQRLYANYLKKCRMDMGGQARRSYRTFKTFTVVSKPVPAYYDVNKPIIIQCDASQAGLGACLAQEGKPVAFASRPLFPAKINYAQIEKELLSVVFACEKFHQYVYGQQTVTVDSDHKPLEYIWKKPLSKTPPRLQRLMLRLQPYDLKIKCVPGKYICTLYMADTLSKAFLPDIPTSKIDDDLLQVVHSLITNLPVTTTKLEDIQQATNADKTLQKVKLYCQTTWPRSQKNVVFSVCPHWNIRYTLYVTDGIVFSDQRIVVPQSLQSQMLGLIHESHFGIEKSKSRARELLYWSKMGADIERTVANCELCIKYQNNHQREPMVSHDILNERFLKVGMDILTFKGKDYLVVVDYYSKYPELLALPDKTASTIVEQCKSVFARHGIPVEIVSDNMPFLSNEFLTFANAWGIKTTTSSATYSQSNGQAEGCVQTMKNVLKKAHEQNRDPYSALLEYRNSPITGLKSSPVQILMSRRLRSKIPVATSLRSSKIVDACADLTKLQSRQKYYYDRDNSKSLPPLREGNVVCYRKNKIWNKSVVSHVRNEPRSYVVRNEHGALGRNRRHLYNTNLKPPVFNKSRSSHCYQSNRPVKSSNVVNYQTDSRIRDSDTRLFNFTSESLHRSTSRYGRPIRFPAKYRDFVVS